MNEFLSHISHEIRTPVSNIAGLTYLARDCIEKDKAEELKGYLEQIDTVTQYLLNLLNNIMDIGKLESCKYELRAEPFNVKRVLSELYSMYSGQMSAKGIDFRLSADSLKYENILGDEMSLRKILDNILSNAFKFTPSGGSVIINAEQKVTSGASITMRFEISDTGVGISEDFIEHLFEPYTQELAENGAKALGNGLGMAICKSMVELQGGTIGVSSKPGRGTAFAVEIPYALCEPVKKEKEASINYDMLKGRRVLVVDDVMINTVITKALLEKYGVIADSAENGLEAVKLFKEKTDFYYDAILMDIQMPVMDGFEAASEIRAVKKSYSELVPIIAMTADAFAKEARKGISDFNDYIIKPVSPDELYGRLTESIKRNVY